MKDKLQKLLKEMDECIMSCNGHALFGDDQDHYASYGRGVSRFRDRLWQILREED